MSAGRFAAALAFLALLLAPAARADDRSRSVLVFFGETIEGHVWQEDSLPFAAYSGNQIQFGVALSDLPYQLPLGFRGGGEAGIAWRHDGDGRGPSGTSLEVWAGPSIRHEGLRLGPVLIRPAFTFGLTAVTASHGLERRREQEEDGEAAVLYYMAPEISLAFASRPGLELVYRVQHRSGGKNVNLPPFGNLGDVTNANVLGLRWRF